MICLLGSILVSAISCGGDEGTSSGGGGTGGGAGTGGSGGGGGAPGTGGVDGGGTDGTGNDAGVDAATDVDATTDGNADRCNPFSQAPCTAAERCAWISMGLVDGQVDGHTACVSDGTVDLGGACTYGFPGETTGFDDCKRGLLCVDGKCETTCSTSPESCATGAGEFCVKSWQFDGPYGVCEPLCNPVTQARLDGAPACGSPDPASPTLGCYGTVGGIFKCYPAGPAANTSDVVPGTSDRGTLIAGIASCAPGYVPVLFQSWDSPILICVAFCEPGPTSRQSPQNAAGLVGSSYTCPARGAGGTHECRYAWYFQQTLQQTLNAEGNKVGLCVDYTQYKYNSNMDGVIDARDANWPSCTTLSNAANKFDSTLTDDVYWGCGPHP